MAITLATIANAIRTRLSADLVPTYAAGVYGDVVPGLNVVQPGEKPVVVFEAEFQQDNGFTHEAAQCVLTVTCMDRVENGNTPGHTALDRIFGNWTPSTQTVPTYGLHFWSPTVSGFYVQPFARQSLSSSHTRDMLVWVETYTTRIQRS